MLIRQSSLRYIFLTTLILLSIGALALDYSPQDEYIIHLPVIFRPREPSIFGVEMISISTFYLQQASDAGVYLIRQPFFDWDQIEPIQGEYHWETIDDAIILQIQNQGFVPMAIIKFSPAWARLYPDIKCGPIAQTAFPAFAEFLRQLVLRYSSGPYNIHYWEIGNEPDVDPALVQSDSMFGCWGDSRDRYYGGGYYAEMLKVAYPAIKAADPASKVLIGGLLLDCDPDHPPAGMNCTPARFFEGILRNQGAAYFDIVPYHAYVRGYYDSSVSSYRVEDENRVSWIYRGGQVIGKLSFLQSVMSSFGVSKPILLNEAGLYCQEPDCTTPSTAFLDIQADFVVTSYARAWGNGLLGSIWYSLDGPGWRQTGLLDHGVAKPSYLALQVMTEKLRGAWVSAAITQYAGVRGYEFRRGTQRIWLLWSPNSVNPQTIPIPTGLNKMYDKYGLEITPLPNPITIQHPVYLEFEP